MKQNDKLTRANIDRRLRIRLRLYSLIFLVMIVIVIIDAIRGNVNPLLVLLGLVGGGTLGLFLSRMHKLSWNEESSQVVARMDWFGGVILVLYLAFALSRNWLFGHWVHGLTLSTLTLSIVAGTMIGRVVGTLRGIRKVLQAWGLLGTSQ